MKIFKHKKSILLIILAAVVIYFIVAGDTSIVALWRTRQESKAQQARYVRLQATIDSLKTVVQKLKSDSAYIEGLARENLGMAKPDETVYKFIPEPPKK